MPAMAAFVDSIDLRAAGSSCLLCARVTQATSIQTSAKPNTDG